MASPDYSIPLPVAKLPGPLGCRSPNSASSQGALGALHRQTIPSPCLLQSSQVPLAVGRPIVPQVVWRQPLNSCHLSHLAHPPVDAPPGASPAPFQERGSRAGEGDQSTASPL